MSGSLPTPQGPGYFSDADSFSAGHPGASGVLPRRGLVNHVRVVAVLNFLQGLLELAMAFLLGGMGIFFLVNPEEMVRGMAQAGQPDPEMFVNIMGGGLIVMGIALLAAACLRFVASARNFVFRSRTLAIVSLFAGLATALTFYCALTSIAIAVYGLIVMFNREVAEAFEMRDRGATPSDVLHTFNSRPL
jgi:hypothetical protein